MFNQGFRWTYCLQKKETKVSASAIAKYQAIESQNMAPRDSSIVTNAHQPHFPDWATGQENVC